MKKMIYPLSAMLLFAFTGCAELQQVANQLPEILNENGQVGQNQIAQALKQALHQGVDKQVSKLTKNNGFYNNNLVKIGLPSELQQIENTLRSVGLGNLADEGVKALNRAAENAVKEATPIFIDAIKGMTISDATNILMGEQNAATTYLQQSTSRALYNKFNPVIKNSFDKVGADKIWTNIISQYNNIPMVKKVNPDLTDYVTEQALKGVFKMIEQEELNIRKNVSSRTTDLMKSVFSLQDRK